MTPRERMLAALGRRQPDRLPFTLGLTRPLLEEFRRRTGAKDYFEHYDIEHRWVPPGPSPHPADFSAYYRGRTFNGPHTFDRDWGYAMVDQAGHDHLRHWESPFDGRDFSLRDALDYPIPDFDDAARYAGVAERNAAWHAKGYATLYNVSFGTYDFSWLIRGYEAFLVDMAAHTDAARTLMDRVADAIAVQLRQMAGRGTDIVGFGEDVGNQTALMISPALWREEIKPRFARIVRAAKMAKPDVLFFYHSDGQIEEIIPDLIEVGVDILNPVQPECMDPVAIKARYGDRLAFWGGVGTQTTMPYGTPAEVKACVRRLFETVGKGGGFLCAPSHVLEPEVPWENVEAFIEACRECVY
jgi:uroporphyrinogen decarboxylase